MLRLTSDETTLLPLLAAALSAILALAACSGSDSENDGDTPSSGGATGSSGGSSSSTGGTASQTGGDTGAGGAVTSTGGTAPAAGGTTPGCTTDCADAASLRTTCPGSVATRDCGSICAERGLVGAVCSGTDCACTPPQTGAGGSAPSCTTTCTSDTTLSVTCPNSQSSSSCSTVCQDRALTGTACVGNDCLCTADPACTTTCEGATSLRTQCGGSVQTRDCGSICSSRGQTGTQCAGNDCACSSGGTGGAGSGGAGAGGSPVSCVRVCEDPSSDPQAANQDAFVRVTCGTQTTLELCIDPCGAAKNTCENNACKCL